MFKKRIMIALLVIFPLVVGPACRFTASDPTATPVATTEAVLEEPATTATEAPTEAPTLQITPSAESTSGPQDLILLNKSLWAQQDTTVFVSFFFENPNRELLFEDVNYTVYLYDANGDEIDNDTSTVRWIFPGQTFGIVFTFHLSDESVTVDSVHVDWNYDSTSPADGFVNPVPVSNAVFWQNGDYPMVTGTITSSGPATYTDIRANIICYDSAGEIVGGGYTYLDFIPGDDYMGFATYVDVFGPVAAVEVFPTFSYSTLRYEGTEFWSEISILEDYFYPDGYGGLSGGLVIQSHVNTVLTDSVVYVTFYDAAGNVTSTGTTYVDVLLPNETLGVSPWALIPPDEAESESYDIFILPGNYANDYEVMENPFVVNSATLTGDYANYVAVNFTNTYSKQASEVDVHVLVYDAEGNIIGGGSDWTTEPLPAGGTAEIEVWVDYADSREVASIKAWVTPNYWTAFE